MQKTIRIAALAALFVAAGAQAQVYVEGNFAPTKVTVDGYDGSFKPSALEGIVGYGLHPNFAVEGVLGFGVKKGSSDGIDFKIKSTYGFYLKPRYQVSDQVELFARVGYLKSKVEASDSTETLSGREGSTAWGLGASYAIDKNLYLTAGYNQFFKKDDVKIRGFNFGVGYKF